MSLPIPAEGWIFPRALFLWDRIGASSSEDAGDCVCSVAHSPSHPTPHCLQHELKKLLFLPGLFHKHRDYPILAAGNYVSPQLLCRSALWIYATGWGEEVQQLNQTMDDVVNAVQQGRV